MIQENFSPMKEACYSVCTSEKPAHLYTDSLNGIVLQIAVYGVREYLIKGTFLLKVRIDIAQVPGRFVYYTLATCTITVIYPT